MNEDIEFKQQKMDLIKLIRMFKHEGIENFVTVRKDKFNKLLQAYKEQEKVIDEKDKLIESMKNFLFKTCMMEDFLEWKTDFDKVKENKE